MNDLISRQAALEALDRCFDEIPMGQTSEILTLRRTIRNLPTANPKVIHCCDCKWWDRLEEGHPYGYCLACRSGTHTERWDISIYRQCKYVFYCADAEPRNDEEEEGEE